MVPRNSKNKLPNDLSEEELYQLLKEDNTEVKEEDIKSSDDVLNFISHFNIKPGDYRVTIKLLYKLYAGWSNNAVHTRTFALKLNEYLEPKDTHGKRVYFINQEALNLSKQLFKMVEEAVQQKTKIPNYKRHFESYINHYNITSGKLWLESYILYYLYDLWTYKTKPKNRLGYNQFYNFCLLYFKPPRNTKAKVVYFQIDDSIYKFITKEQMQEIRNAKKHKKAKEKPKK